MKDRRHTFCYRNQKLDENIRAVVEAVGQG